MNNLTDLIDRYIAAWNETDPDRRRQLIAETYTDDAVYVDPLLTGNGRAGIDAMIAGFQASYPDHAFRRSSQVESHHDRVRFTWELAPGDGETIVAGTDVAVISPDIRLQSVTGFIDQAPAELLAD